MAGNVRLRQVAFVARDLAPAASALQAVLGAGEAFRDPGVEEFGLENVVFSVADTFVELVSPVRDGTTAGWYLDRRGGDSGYMAIFQVPDMDAARRRVDELGVRTVWQIDLPDMAATHLHPRDVPGAIVSLDWAERSESWRWAGPAWTGGAPPHEPGGITGVVIETAQPTTAAARWAEVLGVEHDGGDAIVLDGAAQAVSFVQGDGGRDGGIVELRVSVPASASPGASATVCGVRIVATQALSKLSSG